MHECVICGAAKWDVVNRLHPTTRNPMPVCRSCYEEMVQQAENERQAERGEKQESQRRQVANWNAVADGFAPPYSDEY